MSRFKLGIIGYGHIAKIHIENLLKFPNVQISAIFSRSNKRNQISSEIPFYMDYKKMVLNVDMDAVLISTPTHTHSEVACFCAENGKDIFLEKPMAHTLADCYKILDTVKACNVRLFIAHVLRFWPTYGSIQSYIQNKLLNLGDLQYIKIKRLTTFPWSKWFANQQKSGGVILDLSIHDIDYALWIIGEPFSVSCEARKINKYEMEVYGESTIKIKFNNDTTAICEGSWAKQEDFPFYTYTEIHGSDKKIEFDNEKIYNNEIWKIKNQFTTDNGYYNQLKHFFNVCESSSKRFIVSGEDGKNAVKLCLAAISSAERKGKEIFIEDFE